MFLPVLLNSCSQLPNVLSQLHSRFTDVFSSFSGALLNEFGLCYWASRGRVHLHRFNSVISNGNCKAFVTTLAVVLCPSFNLWSVVVVFKMLV